MLYFYKFPVPDIATLRKGKELLKLTRREGRNNIFQLSSQRSMPKVEVDNKQQSQINRNVLKMEEVEGSKKRKFQADESELASLPLAKHVCFDSVACSDNTNGLSELDSEYSVSCVNSSSTECENDIEMKEESSGSCSGDKMISFESQLDYIYHARKLEDYSEKHIENILYFDEEEDATKGCSNAANFVLSSGRWTINQDSTPHDTKKPTIDQEFEQYFSTLML